MKSIKFSDYVNVVRPNYVFLRLIPNNSIRNNNTHKLAKTISSLYKNITENVRKEESKVLKVLGREFLLGTKFSFEVNSKVSYMIYIEKKKIEFYFIIPERYLSLIKEKITSVWQSVTVDKVKELPQFVEPTMFQLVYHKEDALSLATDRKDNDLLNANLNIVDVLEEGDKAAVFYNFMPISQFSWRPKYEATITKVKRNIPVERDKMGGAYLLKLAIGLISSTVDSIGEALAGEKKKGNINPFEELLDRLNGDKISSSTVKKANSSILDTQIVVMSKSDDYLREKNNARSLTQSFSAVEGDNRLVAKSFRKEFNYTDYNIKAEVNKVADEEAQNFLSLPGRELLEKYDFMEQVETQETQVPEELRKGKMRVGTNTFRGKQQESFLSTDFEFQFLSLILIGPNRAGKSTLIGNLAYDALKNGECVINIDYIGNCELSDEISDLFPKEKVLNIECNDFSTLQGLGYNEIKFSADPEKQYVNAKKQTTQLSTLINTVNDGDDPLSARMNRYLTSASLIVFISGGSIKDVFGVLQNHKKRAYYVNKMPKAHTDDMEEYLGYLSELDDYNKKGELAGTKLNLVEGIISRLNRLKDNPYLEKMLKKDTNKNIDLVEEFQKNQIINIRMPETMFSTDNEKDVYATYWLTKIWLALQIRKEKFKGDRKKMIKINMFIDELYQIDNGERFLTSKLSRLPKFNIKPIISCHYLNQIKQIREELRSANASYMLIAGCDKKNFKELESELYPFVEADLLRMKRYHSMNLIKVKDGYGRFITKLPAPVNNQEKQG